jgi:hypothetical protein
MKAPASKSAYHYDPAVKPSPHYDPDWFVTRIQAAGPVAVYLLAHGLIDQEDDLIGRLQTFAGDTDSIELEGDLEFERIINWMTHAYAVGVAVGQRLQPGAFNADGGGR